MGQEAKDMEPTKGQGSQASCKDAHSCCRCSHCSVGCSGHRHHCCCQHCPAPQGQIPCPLYLPLREQREDGSGWPLPRKPAPFQVRAHVSLLWKWRLGLGKDKGGPLNPEVEDARMAPAKVLGYEPRLCSMLTRGESSSAFTESGHDLCASLSSSHPFFMQGWEIIVVLPAVSSGGVGTLSSPTSLSP